MTLKQRIAMSIVLGEIERVVKDMEGAEDRAADLAKNHDTNSRTAIRCGVFSAVISHNSKELRGLLEHMKQTFPRWKPPA